MIFETRSHKFVFCLTLKSVWFINRVILIVSLLCSSFLQNEYIFG